MIEAFGLYVVCPIAAAWVLVTVIKAVQAYLD